MNRIFIILTLVFLTYISYGFYLSQFEFDFIKKSEPLKSNKIFFNYKINQNIFTQESIGSGSYASIAEEARSSNSNYLLFTDLSPIIDLYPDRYDHNIGLLFGAKIFDGENSYTVYSSVNKKNSVYNLSEALNLNFLVIKTLEKNENFRSYRDGYDVVNLKKMIMNSWKKNKFSTLWSLFFYPFNPKLSLIRLYQEPIDELKFFDVESQIKKTNLYLSSEATAKAIPFADWLVKFPSYSSVLSLASQRLLSTSEMSGDIKQDAHAVWSILKNGNFYISIDTLGDSTGFEAYLQSKSKNQYTFMGDSTSLTDDLVLHYELPSEPRVFYEVILFRNGVRIEHQNTSHGFFSIKERGTYRIQVRMTAQLPLPDVNKWLSWIFTNNFYVN